MSFVPTLELGKSTVGNIKNNTWDVHTFIKLYKEEGEALVAYVQHLEEKVKELESLNVKEANTAIEKGTDE